MNIIERIAEKRAELAVFVTESVNAVLTERMTDEARGVVALDLRLMVSSGLSAAAGPMLDVSPAQSKAISKYAHKPAPSDAAIAAALESEPTIQRAAKKLGCGNVPIVAFMKRGGLAATLERQDNDAPAAEEPAGARGGPKPRFSDEALLGAVERHGPNSTAIAHELGFSQGYVNVQRRRLGVPSPKSWTTAGKNVERAKNKEGGVDGVGHVRWTNAKREKLAEMAMRSPRPGNGEIAAAFGTTESAIQTALSRYGISKDAKGVAFGELRDLSGMKRIACMTCQEPFVSEGKHNRRCNRCKGNDHQVAA